jgi:polysaccharide biosynthesis/export protein
MIRSSCLLFSSVALLLVTGYGAPFRETADSSGTATVKLAAGDVIKVAFAGAPELTQTQKIRTDGRVNLPLIGEVFAAGKTLTEFQNELVRSYKSQLRNNDVLVTLENRIGQVTVSGAVKKPGRVEFDRPTTVFQAIMQAGGITEYGTLRNVRLVRTVNGQQQSQVINLTGMMKGRSSPAVYVKDGDVIFVHESVF